MEGVNPLKHPILGEKKDWKEKYRFMWPEHNSLRGKKIIGEWPLMKHLIVNKSSLSKISKIFVQLNNGYGKAFGENPGHPPHQVLPKLLD